MWKSLESESTIMFADHLMCWECTNTTLLMKVQTNHCDTISWSSYFTGVNETFYMHLRQMKLSMEAGMCDPGTSSLMVRHIHVSVAKNYSWFVVKMMCNSGGIYQRHDIPLSL